MVNWKKRTCPSHVACICHWLCQKSRLLSSKFNWREYLGNPDRLWRLFTRKKKIDIDACGPLWMELAIVGWTCHDFQYKSSTSSPVGTWWIYYNNYSVLIVGQWELIERSRTASIRRRSPQRERERRGYTNDKSLLVAPLQSQFPVYFCSSSSTSSVHCWNCVYAL